MTPWLGDVVPLLSLPASHWSSGGRLSSSGPSSLSMAAFAHMTAKVSTTWSEAPPCSTGQLLASSTASSSESALMML